MGLFRKLLRGSSPSRNRSQVMHPDQRPAWMQDGIEVQLFDGRVDLEVVGESHYQDNLWRLLGDRALPTTVSEWTWLPCWSPRPTTRMTPTPSRCGLAASRSSATWCPDTGTDMLGPRYPTEVWITRWLEARGRWARRVR